MKNKKLWITAVLLSGMLALPVQAAVISPGGENVRRSTVTKTAVSPKTGEGAGESSQWRSMHWIRTRSDEKRTKPYRKYPWIRMRSG